MPDAGIDPRLCILCIMDVFSIMTLRASVKIGVQL